ncbi:MAG: hypothetical protein NXI31_16020 [bacterium]|nr:hypothetical protein [bacterium]
MFRRLFLTSSLVTFAACATSPAPEPDTGTQVVYLQHVRSADLLATIADLGTPAGLELSAHDESNSILVKGHHDQVGQTLALITTLDQPAR